MGRPFQTELLGLDRTYSWALTTELGDAREFVLDSRELPLLTVGSGGSFTSASYAAMLHQELGVLSDYMTPLEIVSSSYSLANSSVLLVTARGRNQDALQSFKRILEGEPKHFLVLCGGLNSPIAKIATNSSCARISEFVPPTGRDGFLAVNSLLTFAVILARSYEGLLDQAPDLPISLDALAGERLQREENSSALLNSGQFDKRETILLLHGRWGKPAAVDLESKLSEAALSNVMIADYRNFAHGRHNFLAKRAENCTVLALVTPDDEKLANKTLSLIPKSVPTTRLSSARNGPAGSIELIVKGFYFIQALGNLRGIDPGRPSVPQFGEKIYKIRMGVQRNGLYPSSPVKSAAIERKKDAFGRVLNGILSTDFWLENYIQFVRKLEDAHFGGIIFDYDGTLCDSARRFDSLSRPISAELSKLLRDGVTIGVATGRGRSVGESLRKTIGREFWHQVLVGYYNGSDVGRVSDEHLPNKSNPTDRSLRSLLALLDQSQFFQHVTITERPKQITFEPKGFLTMGKTFTLLNELIRTNDVRGLSVLVSSHSVDVLAPGISKLSVLTTMKREMKSDAHILCIGDKGGWPGNDYELLSNPYSLSVDEISTSPSSCWNLGRLGVRGEACTLQYLRAIIPAGGLVRLDVRKLGAV